MKKIAYFFPVAAVVLLLGACEKLSYKDTSIKGMAISLNDNSPLAGYTIRLVETETPPKPFTPLIVTTIATTETDAEGKFSFDEELSKRARMDYHAVFDTGGDSFMQELWPADDGTEVKGEIKVNVGVPNFVEIIQAPRGEVGLIVNNQSMMDLKFEVWYHHPKLTTKGFDEHIPAGNTLQTFGYLGMLAGEIDLEIVTTNGTFTDTTWQEVTLEHNEEKEIVISYP